MQKTTDQPYAFSTYKMIKLILKERIIKFIECKDIYPLEQKSHTAAVIAYPTNEF